MAGIEPLQAGAHRRQAATYVCRDIAKRGCLAGADKMPIHRQSHFPIQIIGRHSSNGLPLPPAVPQMKAWTSGWGSIEVTYRSDEREPRSARIWRKLARRVPKCDTLSLARVAKASFSP